MIICLREALTNQIYGKQVEQTGLGLTHSEKERAMFLRTMQAIESLDRSPDDQAVLEGVLAILCWQESNLYYREDAIERKLRTGELL